jgi:hypothetical protein
MAGQNSGSTQTGGEHDNSLAARIECTIEWQSRCARLPTHTYATCRRFALLSRPRVQPARVSESHIRPSLRAFANCGQLTGFSYSFSYQLAIWARVLSL